MKKCLSFRQISSWFVFYLPAGMAPGAENIRFAIRSQSNICRGPVVTEERSKVSESVLESHAMVAATEQSPLVHGALLGAASPESTPSAPSSANIETGTFGARSGNFSCHNIKLISTPYEGFTQISFKCCRKITFSLVGWLT
jgi:hypothetical protein